MSLSIARRKPEPASKIVQRYLSAIKTDRSLGQNFLINEAPIQKSVEFSETLGLGNVSNVLEVGPGPGTLTSAILNTGADVTAIEISSDACDFLATELTHPNLCLVNGDALALQWPDNLTHVIANIPYGISSPILSKIQDYHQNSPLQGICLLVQREFGNRMAMKTPPKDRGPLGISLWLDFDCSIVMEVPRSCFRPQPEVDSSVIGLKPIFRDHISDKERLSIKGLASWCFGRRRRKIRNSLKSAPNKVHGLWGISRSEWNDRMAILEGESRDFTELGHKRPEELDPESWVLLTRMIAHDDELPV